MSIVSYCLSGGFKSCAHRKDVGHCADHCIIDHWPCHNDIIIFHLRCEGRHTWLEGLRLQQVEYQILIHRRVRHYQYETDSKISVKKWFYVLILLYDTDTSTPTCTQAHDCLDNYSDHKCSAHNVKVRVVGSWPAIGCNRVPMVLCIVWIWIGGASKFYRAKNILIRSKIRTHSSYI